MNWLSSLPLWTTVVGWLGLAVLVALVGRLTIRALVTAAEYDDAYSARPSRRRTAMPANASHISRCALLTVMSALS